VSISPRPLSSPNLFESNFTSHYYRYYKVLWMYFLLFCDRESILSLFKACTNVHWLRVVVAVVSDFLRVAFSRDDLIRLSKHSLSKSYKHGNLIPIRAYEFYCEYYIDYQERRPHPAPYS
jgi:hypothetical protein